MAGAGAVMAAPAVSWAARGVGAQTVARAASTAAAGSDLEAVEHIVFLMMENRSYDHYFGDYPKGRGFSDHPSGSLGVFAQSYPGGSSLVPPDVLLPFHLDSTAGLDGTDDLTHDWGPQHLCWNGGRMDSFVSTHTSSQYEGANGAMTMGYYKRADIAFYYVLADAFTLCDGYHCSILGPTHPNRLMANSGTIDPAGLQGGPVTDTNPTPDIIWDCTWPTMQEVLQDAGVSWKVYSPSNIGVSGKYASLAQYPTWSPALYNPITNPEVMVASDHVLPYFTAFRNPLSPLYQNAFEPTFPNDFVSDIAAGSLPSVSWIIPPLGFDEHPSSAPANGMYFTSLVLDALTANTELWSKTALLLMYDENDGWFDHVPQADPARRHTRRVPHGHTERAPGARLLLVNTRRHGTARSRRASADARDIAVRPRRSHRLGNLRPHLPAAARRGAVRCRGAQRLDLAARDRGRSHLDDVPVDPQHEGADASRDRRRHAPHRAVCRHLAGHRIRRCVAERPHQADDARPGRRL